MSGCGAHGAHGARSPYCRYTRAHARRGDTKDPPHLPHPPHGGLAETLRDLAVRVQSLVPTHYDPEAYHERKSELAYDLRRLAAAIDRGAG